MHNGKSLENVCLTEFHLPLSLKHIQKWTDKHTTYIIFRKISQSKFLKFKSYDRCFQGEWEAD